MGFKKAYWLTACLCLCIIYGIAQENEKKNTYTYSVKRNTPEQFARNTGLLFSPFVMDINGLNTNMGFDLQGSYIYQSKGMVEFNYRRSYLDRFNNDVIGDNALHGFPTAGASPVVSKELQFKIFLGNNCKDASETPVIKVEERTEYKVTYSEKKVPVPSKRMDYYSLRLGFSGYSSFVKNDNMQLSGYKVNVPSKSATEFNGPDFTTMLNTQVFSFGTSRIQVSDLIVNIDGHGEKEISQMTELYVDVLYAASIGLANMTVLKPIDPVYGGTITYQEYYVNHKTPNSNWGARVGYNSNSLKKYGFSTGVEIGVRPGIGIGLLNNGYLLFKAGIKFNARLFGCKTKATTVEPALSKPE